jgi:hypothetical protein
MTPTLQENLSIESAFGTFKLLARKKGGTQFFYFDTVQK